MKEGSHKSIASEVGLHQAHRKSVEMVSTAPATLTQEPISVCTGTKSKMIRKKTPVPDLMTPRMRRSVIEKQLFELEAMIANSDSDSESSDDEESIHAVQQKNRQETRLSRMDAEKAVKDIWNNKPSLDLLMRNAGEAPASRVQQEGQPLPKSSSSSTLPDKARVGSCNTSTSVSRDFVKPRLRASRSMHGDIERSSLPSSRRGFDELAISDHSNATMVKKRVSSRENLLIRRSPPGPSRSFRKSAGLSHSEHRTSSALSTSMSRVLRDELTRGSNHSKSKRTSRGSGTSPGRSIMRSPCRSSARSPSRGRSPSRTGLSANNHRKDELSSASDHVPLSRCLRGRVSSSDQLRKCEHSASITSLREKGREYYRSQNVSPSNPSAGKGRPRSFSPSKDFRSRAQNQHGKSDVNEIEEAKLKLKLHQKWDEQSSQILVNKERQANGLPALKPSKELDRMADCRVRCLVEQIEGKKRNNPDGSRQPPEALLKASYPGHILRGANIPSIHEKAMTAQDGAGLRARANILNPDFLEFGVGTLKADDGTLYVCQLFKGSFNLECFDM